MSQNTRSYRFVFWMLALTGLLVDQATKYGVFGWLDQNQQWMTVAERQHRGYAVVPHFFALVRQEGLNQGALFGLGNHPEHGAKFNLGFTIVSALAAVFITLWSCRRSFATDRILCLSLGLILAGALGNLYDRLVFGGVRDFLWVYYEDAANQLRFNYPVFNVADVLLVCGAGLLLLQSFLVKPVPKPALTERATATATVS